MDLMELLVFYDDAIIINHIKYFTKKEINKVSEYFETPLTKAAVCRSYEVVDELLKYGANVNTEIGNHGETVLGRVIQHMEKNCDVIDRDGTLTQKYIYKQKQRKLIIRFLQEGCTLLPRYLDILVYQLHYCSQFPNEYENDPYDTDIQINDMIVERYQYNLNIVKRFKTKDGYFDELCEKSIKRKSIVKKIICQKESIYANPQNIISMCIQSRFEQKIPIKLRFLFGIKNKYSRDVVDFYL